MERIFGKMITVIIKKQLNAEPIIEFYRGNKKLLLKAENLEVMQNKTSFDIDVSVKRGRKKKKI